MTLNKLINSFFIPSVRLLVTIVLFLSGLNKVVDEDQMLININFTYFWDEGAIYYLIGVFELIVGVLIAIPNTYKYGILIFFIFLFLPIILPALNLSFISPNPVIFFLPFAITLIICFIAIPRP